MEERGVSFMRIGVYQFASGGSVTENLTKILGAVEEAALRSVRLLVFHECALCGYPPVETSLEKIDQSRGDLEEGLRNIAAAAARNQIYTAVGTVRYEGEKRYNSIILFDDRGRELGHYDKTALWGWDLEHFTRGETPGTFMVEGLKVGFRICFDIRFPESFRELYREQVPLCFVSFSDTSKTENGERWGILRSHLITRAVENVMTVVSVNSTSDVPTAPTAVFDPNGRVVREAERGREGLLVYDYTPLETDFGMEGRLQNSDYFVKRTTAERRK